MIEDCGSEMTDSERAGDCTSPREMLRAQMEQTQGAAKALAWVKLVLVRRRTFLMLLVALTMLVVAEPVPVMFWWGTGLLVVSHVLRVACAGYLAKDRQLACRGPYGWCRNPLYVGNLMVGVALALMSGRWVMLGVAVAVWLVTHMVTVASEEEFLKAKFGDDYTQYCGTVPRWTPRPPRTPNGGGAFSWREVVSNHEHTNILSVWLLAAIMFIEMVK